MNEIQRSEVLGHIGRAITCLGGPAALARQLSVTTQAVCFWRDGKRKLPEALGARIEFVTEGQVTRQQLWPDDWLAIWPELAMPRAPSATVSAEVAHG